MSNALTGGNIVRQKNQTDLDQDKQKVDRFELKKQDQTAKNSLFTLQQHLVQSHNTLRYMDSRDSKTKILYSLNYFRAIQKRLMMDLREVGTRERVLGDVVDPLIPCQEADP